MPKKLVVVPVNMGSRSARALAETLSEKLGYKVWRCRSASINGRIPFHLRVGTDKLSQFQRFKENDVSCPDFTTDRDVAAGWIRDGHAVVCRTILRGSEGRGIVVAESNDQLVPAPLYTRYTKKAKEFRVHVLNGEVIDVQEKRARRDFQGERDGKIRNLAHGYVFCRDDVVEPVGLRDLALKAVASLRYDLGAVDIIWNQRSNTCYVLEVNSTPGMEGTTLQKYSDKIVEWYKAKL